MRRPPNRKLQLPRQLLDEIGDSSTGATNRNNGRGQSRNGPGARKDRRKAEREQKKGQRRNNHLNQRRPASELEDTDESDLAGDEGLSNPPRTAEKLEPEDISVGTQDEGEPDGRKFKTKKASRGKEAARSPSPEPVSRPSRAVRDKLAEDDAEIAALEKKLGLKGRRKKASSDDDGLDSLLEGIDEAVGVSSEKKRKRAEEKEWLENKRKKAMASSNRETSAEFGSDSGSDVSISGSGDDLDELDELSEEEESMEDDEDNGSEDGSDFEGFDDELPQTARVRENPYVAPVTPDTATQPVKYIPPFMRGASSESEELIRLHRQLQGLLNRLSEANIVSILTEAENLYRTNPRQYMTSTLIDLLLGLIRDRTGLMDTFIILHAGFVAGLYKLIGTDFGAEFVQRTVQDFDRFFDSSKHKGTDGKETVNLISLLTELFNFQVVGAKLIYDYIRIFLSDLSELNTELLLKVIRNSGPQLRQDDPSSLKDTVLLLQEAVRKIGEENLSVRTKFMIETINNLKNNRVKTGISASTITSEHTVRMKKTLGSLNTRTIRATEPLRIGLKDIRNSEKKGKWWLVGASWKNDAESDEEAADSLNPASGTTPSVDVELATVGTDDLLQLAKEQRMNTDVRRAIFIAIMSASDYKDAHVRLMKLRLKKAQEIEIPKVVLHCAGAEKVYNPYYTLIARNLCSEHRLRMAFQFSLWDLFKMMGENTEDDVPEEDDEHLDMRRIANLARLYGYLVGDGSLGISVLKTLDLASLQPQTKAFIEVLIITTILHTQRHSKQKRDETALLNIFLKSAEIPELAIGMRYFVKRVITKTDLAGGSSEKETVKWASRLVYDALKSKDTVGR